ncbi:MAG: hypothetical protein ACFFC3_11815 [Candidatus Odinarchaeota archaeon]
MSHLKPEEIATIARKSNIKMLILTHFDARLFPILESRRKAVDKVKQIFKSTLSAYDGFELII